jgi:thiamine-phosphate pyrophosphorylase
VTRYYITDRKQFATLDELLECIRRNDETGVELIQIREKDLAARELARLVERALEVCRIAKVLVNTRVDVAMACRAAGAHLPSDSPPPLAWRGWSKPGFLFGVSCHSVEEAMECELEGADFAVFGPVFPPISKGLSGPTMGIEGLKAACAAVRIPVFALGGITEQNAELCREAGAAGIAGISLFQKR